MANRLPIIAVIAAVLLFLLYSSVFVVNARQQALVLRFGEIVDVKNEPGIYFKAPFAFFDADSVQLIENRVLRFDLDNIRVQVSGGKFYEVDAFIAYRISDPRVFRSAVSGQITLAEARLRTRLDAALRRVYGLRDFEAALSEERAVMMREVRDQLRPDATSLGLQIEDVRIRRTDLTAEVSQQTFDRMKAERLAEAERLRARGKEAAQRITARADREVVEIVAEARKESEILRGEGEAQRSATFADAYKRDPAFFDFYRSMNAYGTALDNSGTTMVLSPNSEFFRFFRNPDGTDAKPAAPAAPATAPAAPATAPAAPAAAPAAPAAQPAPAQ
ncbi:protease modulator HflC [Mesorhizobium sp. M0674]|uniref:protease modulator HflC n=1 Tax=unclassified Mesorhizobium TaxID=325217 RepID=UPI0033350552